MSIKRGYEPFEAEISIAHGRKLLIQQNCDPEYKNEVFIYLGDENGMWIQDLVRVRQSYETNPETWENTWLPGEYEVLIYGDGQYDDVTETITIEERKEEE